MRIDLRFWAIVLALLLTVGVCHASVVTQGTHEILGSFGWDKFSISEEGGEGSLSMLEFSPTYGYFFLDNIEAQFRVTVASLHLDGQVGHYGLDYSATIWSPLALVLLHAPISDTYFPYVGIGFGGSYFSDSEGTESEGTTILPIICLGGKMLVTETVAVNIEFYYMHQEDALYVEGLDANAYGLTAGLSLLLGLQAQPEPEEPLWKKLWREE